MHKYWGKGVQTKRTQVWKGCGWLYTGFHEVVAAGTRLLENLRLSPTIPSSRPHTFAHKMYTVDLWNTPCLYTYPQALLLAKRSRKEEK